MPTDVPYKKTNNSWTSYRQCIFTTRSSPIYLLDTLHSASPTRISLAKVRPINDRLVDFEGTDYTDIDTIPPSIDLNYDSYWSLDDITIKETYCTP